MKVFINDSANMVYEMIEGLVGAFPSHYERIGDKNCVMYANRRKNKVALVIGGGTGHEPLFIGFVGEGLADAAVCGNLYNAPDPMSIYQTAKAVSQGCGVIFLYGTYLGDIMNFEIAEERLNREGIVTRHIRVCDDVVSATSARRRERRGTAGAIPLLRIVGAACDAGLEIDEIMRLAEPANDNLWSLGVALASSNGSASANKDPKAADYIEYGIGIHGERGILKTELQPVDRLVNRMYGQCMDDAGLKRGDEVCVLVNGLGTISLMELLIVYRRLQELLELDGLRVFDADVNGYCSSYTSYGFSITIMKLNDEQKKYYRSDCYSPFYSHRVKQINECTPKKKVTPVHHNTQQKEKAADNYVPAARREAPVMALNVLEIRDMMIYTAEKLVDSEQMLNEIDRLSGDGDHGICIANGMKKVRDHLKGVKSANSAEDVFQIMGRTMLIVAGGASGVFFGNMFSAAADAAHGKGELGVEDFAEMWEAALSAAKKKGGSRVGDKTMIDALEPAVYALKGRDFISALSAAEKAAKAGMESTVNMRAKFGRGKFLAEGAIGSQDAGATTVWLIFKSMTEYLSDGS